MSPFLTYSKFYTAEDADGLIDMIQKAGVPFQLDHEVNQLDKVYIGEVPDPMIVLKIPQDQFNTVNQILASAGNESTETMNPDYYLYSLSNEELIDVINHQYQWNAFDQSLAKKILTSRDISLQQYVQPQPYKPEQLATPWIVMGYFLSIFAIIGILIGLSIYQGKKTLNNGEIVSIYSKKTKRHGDIMSVVGMIATINFAVKLYRQMIEQSSFSMPEYYSFVLP